MRVPALLGLVLLASAGPARSAPPPECVLILDGRLYDAEGRLSDRPVHVAVLDGRIAELDLPESALRRSEDGAVWDGRSCLVVDARDKRVSRGLVEARSPLGLVEVGMAAETRNDDAGHHPVRGSHRVWEGYDPLASPIPVARASGITDTIIHPGGGLVAGQSAWMMLDGERQTEALVATPVAFPAATPGPSHGGALRELRAVLADARDQRARRDWSPDRSRTGAAPEDLAALRPVLDREVPLLVDADRAADIEALVRFAEEERVRLVIGGGAEAWLLREELAARKVAVLVDPFVYGPGSFDQLRGRRDNAALLAEAGVPLLITTGSAHFARVLRQKAGNAVREGLPHHAAMRAITTTPGEVFAPGAQVGLAPGHLANLVVWTGDPLELSTRVEAVLVGGRPVSTRSRQTELLERYRELPGTPRPAPELRP